MYLYSKEFTYTVLCLVHVCVFLHACVTASLPVSVHDLCVYQSSIHMHVDSFFDLGSSVFTQCGRLRVTFEITLL